MKLIEKLRRITWRSWLTTKHPDVLLELNSSPEPEIGEGAIVWNRFQPGVWYQTRANTQRA